MMAWADQLNSFSSVEGMRHWLTARDPVFDFQSLKRLAVLGAAEEGVRLVELCGKHGIDVLTVADDNPKRQGLQVGCAKVAPVDALVSLDRQTPIVIASHRVLKATERLRMMGFQHVAPFALLQVLNADAFPPHMFYDGWLEDLFARRDRYVALSGLLADEMSKRVLDAVLGFRLTLNAELLSPIIEWDLYGPASLLTYGEDEVYVDGGSYDGDTIRLFIDRVHGKFARVLAFEPDKSTFHRLAANFAEERRVEPINAGLHRRATTLRFDNAGTRGSIIVEDGGIAIPVIGLDEVLGDDRVTFVKMNIEGAELEALKGGERAIKRWAPKLAISAYHRPSDLWQVPELIHALRPDYRLYLRQHDGGVIETVIYALP
jgi:FkbM family methyltransferase